MAADSAHVDSFARNRLPPREQWPDLLFRLPELQYPDRLNAAVELRLVLKVEKGKDGPLKAALASPDQGANDIPISTIELKGDVLTFESKAIGAKYSGKKGAYDGT